MKAIAVIPAHNEELSIAEVVSKALKHVDEVIVIDDGSADRTAEFARGAGATVLQHEYRMGIGSAIKTGINSAVEKGVDVLIILAGDGQHDPDEIPNLIQPIMIGRVEATLTTRFKEEPAEMPWTRWIGNKVLTNLIRLATGLRISDGLCGYRAFSRSALHKIDLSQVRGYELEAVTVIEMARKGIKFMEVPIKAIYEKATSEIRPIIDWMKIAKPILKEIFSKCRRLFA